MGMGSYPETTLAEAREKAVEARKLTKAGVDPLENLKQVKENLEAERLKQQSNKLTFKELSSAYIESQKSGWKSIKHAKQWENTLRCYADEVIGDLAPGAINTNHILEILTPIWTTKTETANRVRNRIELVLDAAKARGLRDGENPARWRGHLDKLLPKPSKVAAVNHHAALPWEQMPLFMGEVSRRPGTSFRAMEMTIMTAARTSEVLNAAWDEVDLEAEVWTIPADRMKANKEHRIPLTSQLKELLQKLPQVEGSAFLFPGMRKGRPLSNMAMMMSLRGMGYKNLTIHGFRSTFRDWAGENTSHPRDVCEQALAHTLSNHVEAAYRRGDLFSKRKRLMEDWHHYIYASAEKTGEST